MPSVHFHQGRRCSSKKIEFLFARSSPIVVGFFEQWRKIFLVLCFTGYHVKKTEYACRTLTKRIDWMLKWPKIQILRSALLDRPLPFSHLWKQMKGSRQGNIFSLWRTWWRRETNWQTWKEGIRQRQGGKGHWYCRLNWSYGNIKSCTAYCLLQMTTHLTHHKTW